MKDFDTFLNEQLKKDDVRREYHRLEPFYSLANQLILLRKQRGLTQQELAEKANTTQAVISRLENVSVRASLETIVRLADALDAVVDLKLKPFEDLQEASTVQPGIESAGLEKEPARKPALNQPPDGFYFGRTARETDQKVQWFQPDPWNFGIRAPSSLRGKKRQLEIA